jgi:beta-lactamase class C
LTTWHKPFHFALFACIAVGCAPTDSHAADDAAIRAIVDKAVQPVMALHAVPGMAVAVTVDGKDMFFNYGVASKATAAPVTQDTLFELGSISTTFSATLTSYAQVQGKLSLADHPGEYMPQLAGSPIDQATLLHLATYTAGGLPLQFPDDVESDAQMPLYFRNWRADAAPGTQRRYSNPSIGLMGHLTALALKADFADTVEQLLFPQLGLKHSFIRVPHSAMPLYAWGHDDAGKPVRMSPGVLAAPTYGVKSSSADMIRYLQANIAQGARTPAMRRAIEGTHVGYYQVGDMVQGLGWEQYRSPVTLDHLLEGNSQRVIQYPNRVSAITPPQPAPPGTLFNKTGSTRGFGAYAAFVPDRRIGIVLLANKAYPIAARVTAAHAILEQLGAFTPAAPGAARR